MCVQSPGLPPNAAETGAVDAGRDRRLGQPRRPRGCLDQLLRNALQALVEDGSNGDARIGLRVEHRTDAITGLLRADVAVLDSAKGRLSSTMIGEADVGRGLGLVRDLVERNGGTVRVVSEPGWSKAVVVELERVEGGVVA